MKHTIISLALMATAAIPAARAATITDHITIDDFKIVGTVLPLDNIYSEATYTSAETGVTYFALIRRATDANGGGIEMRGRSDSGIVIKANPYESKIAEVSVVRSIPSENKIEVYVADKAYSSTSSLYSGSPAGSGEGDFKIDLLDNDVCFAGLRPDEGSAFLSEIVFSYYVPDDVADRKQPELSFPEPSYKVLLNSGFNGVPLSKVTDMPATFSSTDESVASVDPVTGEVTLLSAGNTHIVAQCEASNEFFAGTARYLLTVVDPDVAEVIFDSTLTSDACGFRPKRISGVNPWSFELNTGMTASGYIDGKLKATDFWSIYTDFDLTEYNEATLIFSQMVNSFRRGTEEIDISELPEFLEVGVRESGTDEWYPIPGFTFPEQFSKESVMTGELSLNEYSGKHIDLGFHYRSTTEVAGTWAITDMVLSGKWNGGESAIESIESDSDLPVIFYDLNGRRVVSPSSGIYIRCQGNSRTKIIIR